MRNNKVNVSVFLLELQLGPHSIYCCFLAIFLIKVTTESLALQGGDERKSL
jgi:hypothetical protein